MGWRINSITSGGLSKLIYLKSNEILTDSSRSWAISTLREVTLSGLILLMILTKLMTALIMRMILRIVQVKERGLWLGPPPKNLMWFFFLTDTMACNNYHILFLFYSLLLHYYHICYASCDLSMHAFPLDFCWWQRGRFYLAIDWITYCTYNILKYCSWLLNLIVCRLLEPNDWDNM